MMIHRRLKTIGRTILFFFLPLLVLTWTSVPASANHTLKLCLLVAVIAVGLSFIKKDSLQFAKVVINTLIVLLLVGGTGWFLSPFFFLLYLLPIYLGFLYAPSVAFGFLAALLVIFAFSVGEVDTAFDTMTLLSLLLDIPLVIYLRRKYLILRQTDKDILILEDESGIKDANTISKLLANRITNLGVTVRQPLSFIKQASTMLLEDDLNPKEATLQLQRIKTTATEALTYVKNFESETSANVVLSNKKEKKEKTISKP